MFGACIRRNGRGIARKEFTVERMARQTAVSTRVA